MSSFVEPQNQVGSLIQVGTGADGNPVLETPPCAYFVATVEAGGRSRILTAFSHPNGEFNVLWDPEHVDTLIERLQEARRSSKLLVSAPIIDRMMAEGKLRSPKQG